MKGTYCGELIRGGKVVHSFKRDNVVVLETGRYQMTGLFKNLYLNYMYDKWGSLGPLGNYFQPQNYLTSFPLDYPSAAPIPLFPWHMGLVYTGFRTAAAGEFRVPFGVHTDFCLSTLQLNGSASTSAMNEVTCYTDIDGLTQRVLWIPDDAADGLIINSTAVKFFFTADTPVNALFLASSPEFGTGYTAVDGGGGSHFIDNVKIMSICGLPITDNSADNTFYPRAGDELRVQYMVVL